MVEEMEALVEVVHDAEVVPEETSAQRDLRLKREDYARRNEKAIAEREDIFRRNRLLEPDESLTMDTEAAIRQRCCL
jgi:hypothetical protein